MKRNLLVLMIVAAFTFASVAFAEGEGMGGMDNGAAPAEQAPVKKKHRRHKKHHHRRKKASSQ